MAKSGGTLEQAAHRGGGCPVAGDPHGQARWSSDPEPDLSVGVPVHHSGVGLNGL